VRADVGGQIHVAVRVEVVKRDAPVVAVMRELAAQYPALWVSTHPGVPGEAWPRNERRSHASAVAAAWSASTQKEGRGGAWQRIAQDLCRPRERTRSGAYDFLFDACANGQQLKCLTVMR